MLADIEFCTCAASFYYKSKYDFYINVITFFPCITGWLISPLFYTIHLCDSFNKTSYKIRHSFLKRNTTKFIIFIKYVPVFPNFPNSEGISHPGKSRDLPHGKSRAVNILPTLVQGGKIISGQTCRLVTYIFQFTQYFTRIFFYRPEHIFP